MYRIVPAGALVFVIYFFQNLLLTCNGQLADDNPVKLRLVRINMTDKFELQVTPNKELSDRDRLNVSCFLTTPVNPQPSLKVQLKNIEQNVYTFKTKRTGILQCSYEQNGEVKATSEPFTKRPEKFVAVIRLNRNLTLEELQNIKRIKNVKEVQKLSADPFIFHVLGDVFVVNASTDNSELNILRSNIKEQVSIWMNLMSTRYCPPVPELNITVGYYHPGKVYTFGDNKLKCEGGFYEGVFWNENQIQESLQRLRLLEFKNSTLNTIDDVRNFSAALNANEFVHERELDVLADLFNQLQMSNVLSDMDSRKNTSNELLADSESKLLKMPLTSNVAEAVRGNFAARVENISETQSTGIMFVDSDENLNQAFQNIATLNKSTPMADFFTLNTR
jgi:hypothetical protein